MCRKGWVHARAWLSPAASWQRLHKPSTWNLCAGATPAAQRAVAAAVAARSVAPMLLADAAVLLLCRYNKTVLKVVPCPLTCTALQVRPGRQKPARVACFLHAGPCCAGAKGGAGAWGHLVARPLLYDSIGQACAQQRPTAVQAYTENVQGL